MDLTELVAEMVAEKRHPRQIIEAHRLTLTALVELVGLVREAEARLQVLEASASKRK